MGTVGEWIEVLFAAAFWGGCMLFFSVWRRWTANIKPALSMPLFVTWTLGGLLFGLLTTFEWRRAFHAPLVFLTIALFLAVLATAKFSGKTKTNTD